MKRTLLLSTLKNSLLFVVYGIFLTGFLTGLVMQPALAASQPKYALVIGNAAYQHGASLKNTLNDARDIAEDLSELGFQVSRVENGDLSTLLDKVNQFKRKLPRKGGVALVFYAGHGIQHNGENYLIPVDAKLERQDKIKYETYALNDLLMNLRGRGEGAVNLVILDACRNNPFVRIWGSGGLARSLTRDATPDSTMILYAASPGQTASDNRSGRNGLFTKHLRRVMKQSDQPVELAFSDVVRGVYKESNQAQYPWKEGVLLTPFSFASDNKLPLPKPDPQPVEKPILNATDRYSTHAQCQWGLRKSSIKNYHLLSDSGKVCKLIIKRHGENASLEFLLDEIKSCERLYKGFGPDELSWGKSEFGFLACLNGFKDHDGCEGVYNDFELKVCVAVLKSKALK